MSKKDDKGKSRDDHGGSTAAEDSEFSLWLSKLWKNGETPERIELWQAFGRNGQDRGDLIHHEDFKAGEKLNIEQANKLANEILAAAQYDCDCRRKESGYQLAVIDRNRKAVPLVRRVGPLQPKRSYALMKKSADLDEDDEDNLNVHTLDLRRIKESNEQIRWEKSRNDRVVEGMLLLQDNIIKNQQTALDRSFDKLMSLLERTQEAEDRRAQRDVLLEKEKFKISLMKDGVRTIRNLLPGMFNGAGSEEDAKPAPPLSNGTSGGGNGGNGNSVKDYGPSAERTLIDNFLNDCTEANIDIALFGDCEIHEGKLRLKDPDKPGIFTLKQFYTLAGVRAGRLPVDALDNLMPKSGHEDAITPEQVAAAGAAGVTEGIGMALLEIVGLRQRAKEAKRAKEAAATNSAAQENPATQEESL